MIILVLIGKSASGKTFVRDKLVKEHGYKSLVTFTSRPPRKGEKQDITYHFISQEDFEQKIEEGFFAEYKDNLKYKLKILMLPYNKKKTTKRTFEKVKLRIVFNTI